MSNFETNTLEIAEIEVIYNPKIKPSERIQITTSSEAEKVFRSIWKYPLELKECFYVLYLNRANKVLGYLLVSIGGIAGTVIDQRNIFQTALKVNACSIIVAHNHPSGNPEPSKSDKEITTKIKESGKLLDIQLLDHLILLPEGYTSFADQGCI